MRHVLALICIGFLVVSIGVVKPLAQTPEELQAQIDQRAKMIAELEKEIKTYTELANKSSAEAKSLAAYIKDLEKQVGIITTAETIRCGDVWKSSIGWSVGGL